MKDKIKKNFDYASKSYDNVASIQKIVATDLVNLLAETIDISNLETILDIGTGTGFIPEILHKYNQKAKYFINDISNEMLNMTVTKLKEIDFKVFHCDIEDNNKNQEIFQQNYDLIISNMSFQWIDNLESLIKNLLKSSKNLAFTTLTCGTFEKIKEIYLKNNIKSPIKNYPNLHELQNLVKKIILTQEKHYDIIQIEKFYEIRFNNFFEYKKYVRDLGVSVNFNRSEMSKNINTLNIKPEIIDLNYNIAFTILLSK